MKPLAIFPTLCIFIFVFSILKAGAKMRWFKALGWGFITTVGSGIFFAVYSTDLFYFLYWANFVSVIMIIVSLPYLINDLLPPKTGIIFWLRLSGLAIFATLLSITFFATSMFFSLAHNPLDKRKVELGRSKTE